MMGEGTHTRHGGRHVSVCAISGVWTELMKRVFLVLSDPERASAVFPGLLIEALPIAAIAK